MIDRVLELNGAVEGAKETTPIGAFILLGIIVLSILVVLISDIKK